MMVVSDGHGPGWAGSVSIPSGFGSIWNLMRTFLVSVPTPSGSKRFLGESGGSNSRVGWGGPSVPFLFSFIII